MAGSYCSQHPDRTIPVIIIGLLVFLPGFYHLRIAYYAAKGYRGYSYDDIPDFGDWGEEDVLDLRTRWVLRQLFWIPECLWPLRRGVITVLCSQVADLSLILSPVVYFLHIVAILSLGDLTAEKKDIRKSLQRPDAFLSAAEDID